MKKALKIIASILGCVLLLAALGVGYLSVTEYRPQLTESAEIRADSAEGQLPEGQSLRLLSWNIGYGALGAEADFFMDGGRSVRAADRATVTGYLNGIWNTVRLRPQGEEYDLVMYQEVDRNSARSHGVDELAALAPEGDWSFAPNYVCAYVPFPLPPLGRVNSGLLTDVGRYEIRKADRLALPCPFSWPMRAANLKRCLLATYLPIEGSDKELVLVNLHLEAYSSEEGRTHQMLMLSQFLVNEYLAGNYVIAGGDFNMVFPYTTDRYPITTSELWEPGVILEDMVPEDFQLVYDPDTPSCRLLNAPYDPAVTQHYVIDGFILSPNVTLESVETLDLGFANSDHNPVSLCFTLEG